MAYRSRWCQVCGNGFTPPHRATSLSIGDNYLRLCAQCRRLTKGAVADEPPQLDSPEPHANAAPMRQVVFDLETWGLDRGWGVTLVASGLIHGAPTGPESFTLRLRDYPAWKAGVRSNDEDLVKALFDLLRPCHIGYAHNGEYFDVRWLRTVALKYGLAMPRLKLVDPAALARQKYLLGRNSLEALGDFLQIPHQKLHLSPDVWRHALMDDEPEAWAQLVKRCESDVLMLNAIAGKVTGDVGMVDFTGSYR